MPTFFRRYESALLVMASWCAYSIWTIATAAHGSGAVLITDDAMRLAEVRDLLNGQSWFDTTQWRMNTPFGLAMHWSRLIDAGIAATYLLFRALLDAKTAETATLYLWPMLPFLGLLAALYRTARHLGGELAGLASLALAITCVAFWSDFEPGRLDHHNVQLALIAWMLCFLLESAVAARSAGYAAIAAAISLTIGIETLPYIVTAAAATCVLWIYGGRTWKRQAQYFGFAFAGTSAASITLAVASRYQWAPACDTYSSYYACLAIAGGAGLALCASFSTGLAAAYQRLIVVSGLFAVLFALGFAIDPVCLNGPYGMMDPRLVEIWLSRISEAQSAVMIARSAPAEFVFGYLYALMGLIISLVVFAAEKNRRTEWGLICSLALVGMMVATLEIREVPFPILVTLPAIACCVGLLFRSPRLKGVFAPLAGTLALALSTGAAFAIAGGTVFERNEHLAARVAAFRSGLVCSSPEAMHQLALLPKGRIAAFVDQGPAVLAYTQHSVIAGPYHRNAAGILDDYTIFAGPLRSAEVTLARRGIDYIVTCRVSPDWDFYLNHGRPNALIADLSSREIPDWLRPIQEGSGGIQIYAVDKRKLNVAMDW